MAWTTPMTWSSNAIATAAQLNAHIRDNENYLLSRANSVILRDNGADYTSTDSNYPAIDSTNLTITLTMTTTKVLLVLMGASSNSNAGNETSFDFTVDGTRVGAAFTRGLSAFYAPANNYRVSICVATIAVVTTGSRTFLPVWRVGGGTSSFGSGGTLDTGVLFAAIEVA